MAVLANQIKKEDSFGLRPMDPMKDLRSVADLIEEAFANDLDQSGQNALRELRWLGRMKPILWWMIYANPDHTDFLSGFVWEEGRRIVGNITINRNNAGSKRWLISNLAVSEKYRGRGIARGLMYAAMELVKEYNGSVVSLQVRADNQPARNLYRDLNFKEISGTTYLSANVVPSVEQYKPLPNNLVLRERSFNLADNRAAYDLACVATPLVVQKEWPIRQSHFRLNSNEQITNNLAWLWGGGAIARWVVEEGSRFVALMNVYVGTWKKNHQIELTVHPDLRGELEKRLIDRAVVYLSKWRNRSISVRHPAYHTEAVAAYKSLGFRESQTLTWMKREL
jgi:ribosomal protein S18 acetylase RimI-like enzyme